MGFLSALRNLLTDRPDLDLPEATRERLRDAWSLTDAPAATTSISPGPDADSASEYDRNQWRRKLHHLCEKYPALLDEWPALRLEAKALKLDPAWVNAGMSEEFTMMIRLLIADRRLTEDEQARLKAVRRLMEMSEEQAADLVRSVVAEAEQFFNGGLVIED